jgi:ketosteroid isomerase-like protein
VENAERFVATFSEIWADPDPSRFNEILSENGTLLHPGMKAPLPGSQVPAYVERITRSFPDISLRVKRWAASGDDVLIEWTITTTLAGSRVEVPGADRFTLRDGRAIEGVAYFDTLPLWALLEPEMARDETIDEAAARITA